jgi:uncharacterized protein YbjT (DUF2867 family)
VKPKILVLGATGGTGRLIVSQALGRGYDVAVLARSADKARDFNGAQLVIGDARDEAVLRLALKGREAVISALGTAVSPFREVTLLSTATRSLVTAMKLEQVPRLVCITGLGAGDSRGHGGFFFDRLLLPLMLRKVYEDKDRQEDAIRGSTLDWTIVRPMVLNDKPARGRIKALTALSGVRGGRSHGLMSRISSFSNSLRIRGCANRP